VYYRGIVFNVQSNGDKLLEELKTHAITAEEIVRMGGTGGLWRVLRS